MTREPGDAQLALVEKPVAPGQEPGGADTSPVAEVLVDVPLAHLDRPFEYAVPAEMAEAARPGARVKVRFAGRDVGGYVLARKAAAEHDGRLAPLRRVVSAEPLLTSEVAAVCRQVADHYAGTLADVVRLAVPPRHARAERSVPPEGAAEAEGEAGPPLAGAPSPGPAPSVWAPYPAGAALLRRLAAGESPHALWTAVPDAGRADGWPRAVAELVAATRDSGRGSILVLPDHADLDRVGRALDEVLGAGAHVRLTADQGPERRYANWLRALRGHVRVVIGSRSAAYAPVRDLGLALWWDDGDDSHEEPRAPYPHVREVLRYRTRVAGAALVAGGYTVSPTLQHWLERGDLRPVAPDPAALKAAAPRVVVAGEGHQEAADPAAASARVPSVAYRALREGLAAGPVLVQVPRRGYLVGLSCHTCRAPVRCPSCRGPLAVAEPGSSARCRWCDATDAGQACPACGSRRRRSTVVGERRTAEEIGRAFPGVGVRTSRAGHLLAEVPDEPVVVVATPGAEPVAPRGYATTVLLDGWALLDRAGLDAGTEALRRWAAAAALTRGAAHGGRVVLVGVPPHSGVRPVEALVRWDPSWLARAELEDRRELRLPPVVRTAWLQGPADVVTAALASVDLPEGTEVLGPIPAGPSRTGTAGEAPVRLVLREAASGQASLATSLHALRAGRSMRKAEGELQVRMDPADVTG